MCFVCDQIDAHAAFESAMDARDEATAKAVDVLMQKGGEMYPYSNTAIAEAVLNATEGELNLIGEWLDGGKYYEAGILLDAITCGYWDEKAVNKVLQEINR